MSNCTKPPLPEHPRPSAPELRQNPITGQWVVIASGRDQRPNEFATIPSAPAKQSCPFCAGHEDETTPAVAVYPPSDNESGWQVRVITNLYPAFSDDLPQAGFAPHHVSHRQFAYGRHEVVIESPDHIRDFTALSADQTAVVMRAYRDRLASFAQQGYSFGMFFKNSGRAAGATRQHVHSQLVAMHFVPDSIHLELMAAGRFRDQHSSCVFCDLIDAEIRSSIRVVAQSDHFVALCPYASRFTLETWILPKTHDCHFHGLADELLADLALLFQNVLRAIEASLMRPDYNYFLRCGPFDTIPKDHYHWHIEILPRTANMAGLELGTGIHVNTVAPEDAANTLREWIKSPENPRFSGKKN